MIPLKFYGAYLDTSGYGIDVYEVENTAARYKSKIKAKKLYSNNRIEVKKYSSNYKRIK